MFEDILFDARSRYGMRLYAYCIMPNHWHLIVQPRNDGDVARFMQWLTLTYTQRWHAAKQSIGTGHLYQGRYKAFPVQTDEYFLWVCRYVERNPLRARLVDKAEDWRWGSAWHLAGRRSEHLLDIWPTDRSGDYLHWLNQEEDEELLQKIRTSVNRAQPLGNQKWTDDIVEKFKLQSTIRNRGRQVIMTPLPTTYLTNLSLFL